MKNTGFCLKIWPLYDISSFSTLMWYVPTNTKKKNQLNVPKKLVLSKKFIFNNYGDILSNSIGKNWE